MLAEFNENNGNNEITTLENGIIDLRHQLITASLYRQNRAFFLDDLSLAPPITIVENRQGDTVDLFLDNIWGINNYRLENKANQCIPDLVKQTWLSIREPKFEQLIWQYRQTFEQLDSDFNAGFLPDYKYNLLLDAMEKTYIEKRDTYMNENELDILHGMQSDLSMSLDLLLLK